MPILPIQTYCDSQRHVPVVADLLELYHTDKRTFAKCVGLIELLREFGTDLRGKFTDYLRQGVWELRARAGNVQYRICYACVGGALVLLHGFRAHVAVDQREYDRATERLAEFRANPDGHTARLEDALAEECAALPALLFPAV